MLKSSTMSGLVRHDGSARTAPSGERNDWSRKAQTKSVRNAFVPLGSGVRQPLVVTRTFGIR